jgi:UDP-3-O-[3-hydroxymyristoyl] glucosamine N-acyltransferase
MGEKMKTLIKLFKNYNQTCSIINIKDKSVTFIRDEKFLHYLDDVDKDIWVIVPVDCVSCSTRKNVKLYYSEYPEYDFVSFHNYIYKNKDTYKLITGNGCNIHPSAIIGPEGIKLVFSPEGNKIQFLHTGGVVIGNNVSVGPQSVIHRGSMDDTIIGNDCVIGTLSNIGHNCVLGNDNVIISTVNLNGGVKTGKNCWFASGSLVKTHLTICDNVVIGMGAVVTKDIIKEGIYVGNPARYLKSMEKGWNF